MRWREFFQEDSGDYSMTRLLAFVCCLVGCYVAVRHPTQWQTVSTLIGGGAVGLLTRQKVATPTPLESPAKLPPLPLG